jgi:hypothetical protein
MSELTGGIDTDSVSSVDPMWSPALRLHNTTTRNVQSAYNIILLSSSYVALQNAHSHARNKSQ